MTAEYNDTNLIDAQGQRVGVIERTYIDDAGETRMVAVKIGTLLAKHRLVPIDGAPSETGDGLQVMWNMEAIEASPSVDPGDTLEGEQLDAVRQYYAAQATAQQSEPENPDVVTAIGETDQRNRPANDFPGVGASDTPAEFGQLRDLGDVIEIPIVEEVLVKKQIVREVLRIRKIRTTDTGTASADLRKENVEFLPGG